VTKWTAGPTAVGKFVAFAVVCDPNASARQVLVLILLSRHDVWSLAAFFAALFMVLPVKSRSSIENPGMLGSSRPRLKVRMRYTCSWLRQRLTRF
jgi:hypothetical protein